jgi:predicted MFS family arabinose efflux permease
MPDVHGRPSSKLAKVFPNGADSPKPKPLGMLYKAISDPEILASLGSIFFVSVGFTVFRVYLTQYGISGPYIVGVMAVASVFAAVPIGRFLDSTRKRAIFMTIGFLAEGTALSLIFYQPTIPTILLWSLVFGIAVMLIRVPQAVVIAERTILENRATAMGANHGVEHIGYGVGAFLGGILLLLFGFSTLDTFWLVAGISVTFGLALIPLSRTLKMA